MATVTIDRITMLQAHERHGALKRLVREALVSGISAVTDWQVLTTALDDAGLPQYGDFLTSSTASNAYEMKLVERNPRVLDNGKVVVELVYESTFDSEQDLDNPRGGLILGEVRCSVQQKTSNVDINGDLVETTHTYPAGDIPHAGETITHGAEFQYYDAQRSIVIHGIKVTATPWLVANGIVGHVNDDDFSGDKARTWLCTACSWRQGWYGGSATNNHYFMDFEFQYDSETWDPMVQFVDDITNSPPPDLVENVGYKRVEKLPACDFEFILGNVVQGG